MWGAVIVSTAKMDTATTSATDKYRCDRVAGLRIVKAFAVEHVAECFFEGVVAVVDAASDTVA